MTTLKDVQKDPKKLDQFIKERERDRRMDNGHGC